MSTDLEVTIRGDAYALVPGATYVLEVDRTDLSQSEAQAIRDAFEKRADVKVIVLGGGVHIVPAAQDRADPPVTGA